MDLNINYEETRNVGNQVTQKGGEFQELLNNIKGVNTELQAYWEGSDASKYSNAVAVQAEEMQKLVDAVNEIGAFLVKVGNAYEEAMNANMSGING